MCSYSGSMFRQVVGGNQEKRGDGGGEEGISWYTHL